MCHHRRRSGVPVVVVGFSKWNGEILRNIVTIAQIYVPEWTNERQTTFDRKYLCDLYLSWHFLSGYRLHIKSQRRPQPTPGEMEGKSRNQNYYIQIRV